MVREIWADGPMGRCRSRPALGDRPHPTQSGRAVKYPLTSNPPPPQTIGTHRSSPRVFGLALARCPFAGPVSLLPLSPDLGPYSANATHEFPPPSPAISLTLSVRRDPAHPDPRPARSPPLANVAHEWAASRLTPPMSRPHPGVRRNAPVPPHACLSVPDFLL